MRPSMRLNVDMKSTAMMSIGQIAAHFGLATHVLRHWESVGLLTPGRVEGDRRRYGPDDLFRVAVILRAKEAGFGLEDIHEMITARNPGTRHRVLRRHRADLVRRIAQAQTSLELIDGALTCDHGDFTACPHFQETMKEQVRSDIFTIPYEIAYSSETKITSSAPFSVTAPPEAESSPSRPEP
ncbi:MerR family transcriptional regulator [Streptomyces anulatus]|uniref:MerR family transcriptional regulator n=1 Tax=Streptomyces anulatus TaxID=1892 RepID=UPI003444B018